MTEDRNMDFSPDDMQKKLLILFILEKMEFPLTDGSLSEIVVANPTWINYMDFRDALFMLSESRLVMRKSHASDTSFSITQSGRDCLAHFYTKIPASIREEITKYAKDNRNRFKRSQEYTYDYFKNSDATHTLVLRIRDHAAGDNLLEVKIKTPSRSHAVKAAAKWKDKAAGLYEMINSFVEGVE